MFCHHNETIKHLFFECHFTRSIWSAIQVASNLYPPSSVANIFGNWLHGIDRSFRKHCWVGAIALLWSLWLCRNDRVFNAILSSPMQVIFRCAHYLREWSILQHPAHRDLFMEVCSRLEQVARDVFTRHGWQHNLRIGPTTTIGLLFAICDILFPMSLFSPLLDIFFLLLFFGCVHPNYAESGCGHFWLVSLWSKLAKV